MRKRTSALNHLLDEEAVPGAELSINRRVAAVLGIGFLKAWVFYFIACWAGAGLAALCLESLPPRFLQGLGSARPLLVVLGLAAAMHTFYERK